MLCEGCTGGLYRRLDGKRRWGITHDNTVHVPSNATQGLYLSGWLSRLNSACPSIKICRAFKKFFSFAPMSNRFRMPTASIRYALYVNIIGWWFFFWFPNGVGVLQWRERISFGEEKEACSWGAKRETYVGPFGNTHNRRLLSTRPSTP